ncbi:hypothetical protein IEQ44_10765 [Nocardioides sp. Y6]|uniref:Uncharacterized protein n=1 Tax=Nocardioides malaquae TaxID=2773426 RepID=A0ABR9RUA9_9ACTN|nr:hypothetical protein [Nocardioides malaquae]MBE7325137.1 hypothetical protein [Nocardioides malaquae]
MPWAAPATTAACCWSTAAWADAPGWSGCVRCGTMSPAHLLGLIGAEGQRTRM